MTGSAVATLGRPTIHGYIAAKGGLQALTRSLAADGPKGITVNAIAPGFFGAELNEALLANAEFSGWVSQRAHAAGPLGEPREIGRRRRLPRLARRQLHNGHVLAVDGGLTVSL